MKSKMRNLIISQSSSSSLSSSLSVNSSSANVPIKKHLGEIATESCQLTNCAALDSLVLDYYFNGADKSLVDNEYIFFGISPVEKQKQYKKAEKLVKSLDPETKVSSKKALELIETFEIGELKSFWQIKSTRGGLKLADNLENTVGTQCLINLFDAGRGWIRCGDHRGDMLIMTAKLVERGACLDGISYYGQTVRDCIQKLISDREGDSSAELNDEVMKTFSAAGYEFTYPGSQYRI